MHKAGDIPGVNSACSSRRCIMPLEQLPSHPDAVMTTSSSVTYMAERGRRGWQEVGTQLTDSTLFNPISLSGYYTG
jgi:hypothetical protein